MFDNNLSLYSIENSVRKKRPFLEKTGASVKKSQIAACADAFPFGGTIFGGWWIDSASKGKSCLHSCNFGFFIMSSSLYMCVKPFQKGILEGNDPKCIGSFLLTHFISNLF